MEFIKTNPKPIRLFFFWSGIIATFAYRIILFLDYYYPSWVRLTWYIGTLGFIIYFYHRFSIQNKRAKLVKDNKLVEEVERIKDIDQEQKARIKYLVETSLTSKARWNSLFVFILSLLVLIIGLIIDFIIVN